MICCSMGRGRRFVERLPLTTSAATSDEEEGLDSNMEDTRGSCTLIVLWWLLGVGSLWAWNAFITPTDYYSLVFTDFSFLPLLTTSFTMVGLVATLALQPLQTPLRTRIIAAFVMVAVAFAFTSAFVSSTSTRSDQYSHASVLIVLAATASVSQGFLTASLASYATAFKAKHMAALTTGQAAAGVAVSSFNVVRKLPEVHVACGAPLVVEAAAAHRSSLRASATAASRYFGASSAMMVVCLCAFLCLEQLPLTKVYQRDAQRAASKSPAGGTVGGLLRLAGGPLLGWGVALMLLFSGTLVLYPTITSSIPSAAPPSLCRWRMLFVPLGFVVFNVGDTLGRSFVGCLPRTARSTLLLVLSRLLFAPLLLALHAARNVGSTLHAGTVPMEPGASPSLLEEETSITSGIFALVGADVAPIVTLLLLAITNGWLTTAIFVHAPAMAAPEDRPAAGALLTLWLNVGLVAGSLGSAVVAQLAGVS